MLCLMDKESLKTLMKSALKNEGNMGLNLDEKEVEGKIGEVGAYSVDVDKTGKVEIEVKFEKEVDGVKGSNSTKIEVSIFTLLEKLAAKTENKIIS